jgi:ABC-2 type transport system ATP-binding protein
VTSATPVLSLRDLRFSYGDTIAIDGITAEVPSGTIGLVGANGAGKTTLLKLLIGTLPSAPGTVETLGVPVMERRLDIRSRVGWMPEGDCLPPDQTAADFIGYAAELGGLPTPAARQRASDVLALVGLHEERFRPIGGFSTGMKQRAKLAQAIVHDPDLVLLDEPTAGLDPDGRDEMLDLIARLKGFGIDVVVSSHVLTDIERTCDWVVMLDGGTLLRNGPLTALSAPEVVSVEVIGDPQPVTDALTRAGADVELDDGRILVRSDTTDAFVLVRDALAATGTAVRRLGARRTTLEDVYLKEGHDG